MSKQTGYISGPVLVTLAFASLGVGIICSKHVFPQIDMPLLAIIGGFGAIPLMLLAVIKLDRN